MQRAAMVTFLHHGITELQAVKKGEHHGSEFAGPEGSVSSSRYSCRTLRDGRSTCVDIYVFQYLSENTIKIRLNSEKFVSNEWL